MSVHTYVGARYVPRFTGTYDITQQYEALDVVDNGSGTSYIARKTVPAGTPLTDTEFWFVYGASSGAIIQLQNDMITAQNDITGLQGDMTNAQNDITALQNEMGKASAIGEFARQYANKKIVILGDSLSMPTATWAEKFKEIVEQQNIGCTVTNLSGSGQRSAGALTAINAQTESFDLAIVWVGINDAYYDIPVGTVGSAGTYIDNMSQIFAKLYSLNSMVNIFAFSMPWYDYTYKFSKSSLFYSAALANVSRTYGVAFKDI